MKISTELLRETAVYIKQFFNEHLPAEFTFHNYTHTVNIVRYCDTIGLSMDLDKQELMTLHIAAWFQDSGYCTDPENHEEASVVIARNFLTEKGIDETVISAIEECILSTRSPQQPVSLISQVLCDATMYYLADNNFIQNIEKLRNEIEIIEHREYSDKEWLNENIQTLENHFYFTASARKLFDKSKEKLKTQLKEKYEVLERFQKGINNPYTAIPDVDDIHLHNKEDIKLERGVETLFRITARRHMELTNMAHDKANLIISINAIIISVILSVLVVKLDEHRYLIAPTLLLILTSVATIIIAILSTRPRLLKDSENGDHKLVQTDDNNILFFGHFSKMPLDEFERIMKETYKNREQLYDSLTKDIYYQGIILVWKYRYITISYNIFIVGFVASIAGFIIAFIFH